MKRFTITGRPIAKQRARTVNGHTYTPPRTRAYEEIVAWASRTARPFPPDARVSVKILLYDDRATVEISEIPGVSSKLRGDIDNYAKSIMDGLVKGGVIHDDRQIDSLEVRRAT